MRGDLVLFAQIKRLEPISTTHVEDLKSRLNDLAFAYKLHTAIMVLFHLLSESL